MTTHPKLIIDIGHPCEVHHYKFVYWELRKKGWTCLFVAKDKDVIVALLKEYGLPFVVLAKNRGGLFSKILQLPLDLIRFYKIIRRFHPDMVISSVSVHCSWVSALMRIPHIAFIDTEPRKTVDFFTLPFVQAQVTALSYYRDLGKRQVRYSGNHELAYLHPRRFQPDASVRRDLGLADDEPFVIVRFVAWKAFHDFGLPRMSEADRIRLVREIGKFKRVFITSEDDLPEELRSLSFPLAPHRILDALAFADLYVGEGITMASEAATCGTLAVLFNSMRMGYCLDAEKHGMLYSFTQFSTEALQKIVELLSFRQIRSVFRENHQRFMADKIDVTAFMVWFISSYPESLRTLKNDARVTCTFKRDKTGCGSFKSAS